MKDDISQRRRAFLRNCAVGTASGVAAILLPAALVQAKSSEKVSEDDALAKQLDYVENAAESKRTSDQQYCNNCRYYKGDKSNEWAPCDLFSGKQVAGPGWCKAWQAKG